jgi:membrane peptidoglycan carboxypeptidase
MNWVSTEDELPPISERLYDEKEDILIAVQMKRSNGSIIKGFVYEVAWFDGNIYWSSDNDFKKDEVVAWMPIVPPIMKKAPG